ncbi:hypothetical protein ANN_06329 [Periplaneta americana]|uniref:Uncharacterized protein n=1 Tax=Periplaneta americana TaxID=6978 RepID=A0ABQ8TDE9_PERAM|nr:hypothetical protein ANN_06329 [Periplaneta americana]
MTEPNGVNEEKKRRFSTGTHLSDSTDSTDSTSSTESLWTKSMLDLRKAIAMEYTIDTRPYLGPGVSHIRDFKSGLHCLLDDEANAETSEGKLITKIKFDSELLEPDIMWCEWENRVTQANRRCLQRLEDGLFFFQFNDWREYQEYIQEFPGQAAAHMLNPLQGPAPIPMPAAHLPIHMPVQMLVDMPAEEEEEEDEEEETTTCCSWSCLRIRFEKDALQAQHVDEEKNPFMSPASHT